MANLIGVYYKTAHYSHFSMLSRRPKASSASTAARAYANYRLADGKQAGERETNHFMSLTYTVINEPLRNNKNRDRVRGL